MRRLLFAVFFALAALPAHAQQARVVAACGSLAPFGPDAVGGVAFPTMDTTGKLCLSGGGGGGSIVGGTTPVTGTCPAGQFLYNNSGVVGCSASSATIALPQAVTGGVSGGVPYFSATTTMTSSALLAANALVVGGGAGVAPSTVTTGAGVVTALGQATNSAIGLATAAAPLTVSTGGTMTGAFGYYVCTTTCTITLPVPAAGFQFCVRNDSTVVTVITIAAISTVLFEKTTYNGYGTVSTGKITSGGALGDKICLIGRDATHYLIGSFVGTWTNT